MQLVYGSATFAVGSVDVTSFTEVLVNSADQPYSRRVTVQVQGFLDGDSQAGLTQDSQELYDALAVPYRDLILYEDSGGASALHLTNADSISGVVVTRGPDWPSSRGAEYVNYRSFAFSASAEYQLQGTARLLMEFSETISLGGGKPLFVCLPALNGPSQRQQTYKLMPWTATQSGTAVGYKGYPLALPPRFPGSLKQAGRISRASPRRRGRGYEGYRVSWEYEFESPTPLFGLPALWP